MPKREKYSEIQSRLPLFPSPTTTKGNVSERNQHRPSKDTRIRPVQSRTSPMILTYNYQRIINLGYGRAPWRPQRRPRASAAHSDSQSPQHHFQTSTHTGNVVCGIPPEMAAALVSHLILLLLEKLRQINKKSTWKMVCNVVLRMLWW